VTAAAQPERTAPGLRRDVILVRLQDEHDGPGYHDDVDDVRDCRPCRARYGVPLDYEPRIAGLTLAERDQLGAMVDAICSRSSGHGQ
jgi:hypothetical protein